MNIEIDIQCCRTCLESTTENYLLDDEILLEKVETITSTTINKEDGLPLYFCATCYNKLEIAYQFRQQSLRTFRVLNEYIDRVKSQFNEIFQHKVTLNHKDMDYEESTVQAVTLKNKHNNINLDECCVDKYQIEEIDDLQYAIENIKKVNEAIEKESDVEETILTDRVEQRVKEIVTEHKPGKNSKIEVAKVESGSRILVKCEKCNKVFKKENLVRHMAAHTGESEFKCHICMKNFTQKTGLNRHMLTHTGEKPYKCDECGKKFSQSKSLKFHKTSHGSGISYDCTLCHYRFFKPENLKNHMLKNHSSKPEIEPVFECRFCKKSFKTEYSLQNHLKKFHADVDLEFIEMNIINPEDREEEEEDSD